MNPIRISLSPGGDIKAELQDGTLIRAVVIDRRTGNVISTHQAPEGSDAFRRLVHAARKEA